MILSYDSILGIPTIEEQGETYNLNNQNSNNLSLRFPSFILLLVIILVFIILFTYLGKKTNIDNELSNSNRSTNLLTVILGGVVIIVFLLSGLQYFFNINLTARLNNLFTDTPSLDLVVEQNDQSNISEIPEIEVKKQVYHIPGNEYNFENAKSLCQAYGSRLATYNEIENAYKNGAEWCSYGWSDRQLALFPTQKKTWNYLQNKKGHENDCGRPGINGGYIANPNVKFGVNCYGYKPEITQQEKELMDSTPLYPRTLQDKKQEERVNYWKSKIPEILVSPFNRNIWSLV
tara:strand:- start:168 stop:1037 length:870 start_codon:yes stop_codon:yes gene_type:complete